MKDRLGKSRHHHTTPSGFKSVLLAIYYNHVTATRLESREFCLCSPRLRSAWFDPSAALTSASSLQAGRRFAHRIAPHRSEQGLSMKFLNKCVPFLRSEPLTLPSEAIVQVGRRKITRTPVPL